MNITSTHLVYSHHFKSRISLLTMREGATTHSFIEYCHKKHVTVFEVRFHFVNGLNPEEEKDHFTPLITLAMMYGPFSLIPRLFPSYLEKHSYFQAPKPACHRSEKMRTRLRTFIMASFTKLT